MVDLYDVKGVDSETEMRLCSALRLVTDKPTDISLLINMEL